MKQTNEITMVDPLLATVKTKGKNLTFDALHTQTKTASLVVEKYEAHYFFTVKGNQPTLLDDIVFHFKNNLDDSEITDIEPGTHGRIETRQIWTTTELNDYLTFPHVKQVFKIKRTRFHLKNQSETTEVVYGITSRPKEEASPKDILKIMRKHWGVENSCHYILDWAYREDHCRIRTGYGPENITALRRFAIGLLKSKAVGSVKQKMRELSFKTRPVLDLLKMTKNSRVTIDTKLAV